MKKYSIIILILCSWAMSLFAISCSDQESKPQPFLEIKKDTVVFCTRGCKYFYCSEYKHRLASQCAFIRELVYGSRSR